jgi:hypothetical protein
MTALPNIVGPERAAAHALTHARQLEHLDGLPHDVALRVACERIADDDPTALAAPGQIWTLRPDVDEDDAPACALGILARTAEPPAVLAQDENGTVETLPLETLRLFHLTRWEAAPWA